MHNGTTFVCTSCLNVFTTQQVLDSQATNCLRHAPQQVVYPEPDDCKLKFNDHNKEHPFNLYLVCDFESFFGSSGRRHQSGCKTRIIDEHQVSGSCCYRVSHLPQYETPPTVYSGPT